MRRSTIFKSIGLMTVVVIALLVSVIAGFTIHSNNQRLARQQDQLAVMQNQVTMARAAQGSKAAQQAQNLTGADDSRKSTDDSQMNDLMRTAMTWNSYADYMTARATIMRRYGFDEKSDFMTKIMPTLKGGQYNAIDHFGLNMSLTDFSSSVTNIAATDYTYFALAQIAVQSRDGNTTSTGYDILTYTIGADHKIRDLIVQAVPVRPNTAG